LRENIPTCISSTPPDPFACPIIDQDGKMVECKGGAHLADEQILGMNYFVRAVGERVPGQ
jgi:basic membrane protein A and related proteins